MPVSKELYAERKQQGLCPRCGRQPEPGYARCSTCRSQSQSAGKTYYSRHTEAQQKYSNYRKQGLCPQCGQLNPTNYAACEPCRSVHNKRGQITRQADKDAVQAKERGYYHTTRYEAITTYGGVCVCCGEDHYPYLQLDHINGGGTQHRKELGTGSTMYYALKQQGYPPILQVLCANCHQAKTTKLECRHRSLGS